MRKETRTLAIVTSSDMPTVHEGDTFFLEYKKHQTACQVYVGEQMLYTADRVDNVTNKWAIHGGWFRVELEEI